jgi:hypothetical protein
VASDIFFSPAGGVLRICLPLYQPTGVRGMPPCESAADDAHSSGDYQSEIVYFLYVEEFISDFNQKAATSAGGMYLQIENCIVALN